MGSSPDWMSEMDISTLERDAQSDVQSVREAAIKVARAMLDLTSSKLEDAGEKLKLAKSKPERQALTAQIARLQQQEEALEAIL